MRYSIFNLTALYIGCWVTNYGNKLMYGIDVADPGAVPGASTNHL